MSSDQCPGIGKYIVSQNCVLFEKFEGSGILKIIYLILRYFFLIFKMFNILSTVFSLLQMTDNE